MHQFVLFGRTASKTGYIANSTNGFATFRSIFIVDSAISAANKTTQSHEQLLHYKQRKKISTQSCRFEKPNFLSHLQQTKKSKHLLCLTEPRWPLLATHSIALSSLNFYQLRHTQYCTLCSGSRQHTQTPSPHIQFIFLLTNSMHQSNRSPHRSLS